MFVLPFYRGHDSAGVPITVFALILLNSVAWIATSVLSSPAVLFRKYGFVPADPHFSTAFTSMFLHAGLWHLAGNMWFLWMFGRRVERSLGPLIFFSVYFLSGFGGVLLHYLLNRGSSLPLVGASGAISGIVGCFFVLFPNAEFDLAIYLGWWRVKQISANTRGAVGAWIGEQTVLGLLTQAVHFSPVAFWGHVGGFLVGLLGSLLIQAPITINMLGLSDRRPLFHGPPVMSKSDISRLDRQDGI